MPTTPASYVPYADSVEVPHPDEEKTFDEITDLMHRISAVMNDRYRHAVRSVHSKSHGLIRAELRVRTDLPEPLAQGLFAQPGVHPAILRISTTPGDILADSNSTPHGLAVKVLSVDGPKLPGHEGNTTQDFVMINAKVSPHPTPRRSSRSRRSFSPT